MTHLCSFWMFQSPFVSLGFLETSERFFFLFDLEILRTYGLHPLGAPGCGIVGAAFKLLKFNHHGAMLFDAASSSIGFI